MKKIFIDVETTGVNPRMNGIWQVSGCVEIPGQDLKWFNFILNPPESLNHWDDRAKELFEQQAKHKQYNLEKDGLTYPVFHKIFTSEILAAVDRYNKHDKFFFIGYNSSFDDAMMRALFDYCGDRYYGSFFAWPSIDVAVLAAERLGDELLKMPNVKLNSMAARLGITVDQSKLHDAQYDIELTRDMYHIITDKDIWAGVKPATEETLKKIVGSLPDFPDISDNRRWKYDPLDN
jgi:DNA polymerase III subunit epsilon